MDPVIWLLDSIKGILILLLLDSFNFFCLLFLILGTMGYVFFMTAMPKHYSKKTEPDIKHNASEPPLVSIIIPIHNEEETIIKKIENTFALNYPPERLEVVAIDDGSTDKTPAILEELKRSRFPRLKIIRQSRAGKSSAENTGLQNVEEGIVVITDADVPINAEALGFMKEDFMDPFVGGVTCSIMASEKYVQSLNLDLGLYVRRLENEVDSIFGMSGPFVAFRRELVQKIDAGIFSSDTDTGLMIRKKGYRVLYDPRIVSDVDQWRESRPKTVKGELKKLKHLSFGNVTLFLRHKDMLFRRKYGVFGWIIAPRYILFVFLAPIIFVLLSANSLFRLIQSDLIVFSLILVALFLGLTFLLRKVAPESFLSKAFYLVFMYVIGYYAQFWYYLLFAFNAETRGGAWSRG